jgi:hypothetical protein
MAAALNPTRSALGGSAIVMACACGLAANGAKLIALAGIGASAALLHPIFLGVGAALILHGLWRTERTSAYLAVLAFGVLAVAAAITPPSAMTLPHSEMSHMGGLPWGGTRMAGAALYIVAAAPLGYAFWRAFPSPVPSASATAIGGMALATGCTACCMVTGAIAGMVVTAGASVAFESVPIIFFGGLAAVAAGLYRLGGARAAVWPLVGGLIAWGVPKLLELTGSWTVAGVGWRSMVSYLPRLLGAGVILYGFVVAYNAARVTSGERARSAATVAPAASAASGD